MLALRELQRAFARGVLERDPSALAGSIRTNGLAPAARIQIYRNNVVVSLVQALADVYPATQRLVGEDFFGQVARGYMCAHPSLSGNLHEFGAAFPEFLRNLRESAELPYLADVAALEWAWHEVFHAAAAAPLDAARLAGVAVANQERLRFRLHPAVRLVASRYPVLSIWKQNRSSAPIAEIIHLDAGADFVVVLRPALDVIVERLSCGDYAMLEAFEAGAPLEDACAAAAAHCADPGTAMRRFVASGVIADFEF